MLLGKSQQNMSLERIHLEVSYLDFLCKGYQRILNNKLLLVDYQAKPDIGKMLFTE